jgi:hypothetical protein
MKIGYYTAAASVLLALASASSAEARSHFTGGAGRPGRAAGT